MSDQKPSYPSRTADQFVVRFPDGMRDRLKEAAHVNGRSMNAEIIARLDASFEQGHDLGALQKKVTHLEQRLRDSQYLLATEAALAAIVAISLKTLSSRIPTELRRALAVDAAEDTADSVLSKPLPRLEKDSEDGNATEFVEKVRKLVDELRLTGEALSAKAKARDGHTTELRESSGTERSKRQLRIRRDEKP